MAYDPGAIDATLAAAVGDDPALIVELRLAFVEGVADALASLRQASDPETWCVAAWRLKGLAASFGAVRLMALAGEAVAGGEPDAALLVRLTRLASRL